MTQFVDKDGISTTKLTLAQDHWLGSMSLAERGAVLDQIPHPTEGDIRTRHYAVMKYVADNLLDFTVTNGSLLTASPKPATSPADAVAVPVTTACAGVDPDDEEIYEVSVYKTTSTEADREAGENGESETLVECEKVSANDLRSMQRKYGFYSASSSHCPGNGQPLWFSSNEPDQDRDYFERAIEKTYSLHFHSVRGEKLDADEYMRVAELLDVRLPLASAPRVRM